MLTRQTIVAITLLLSANANAVPPRAFVFESLGASVGTETGFFISISAEQSEVFIDGEEFNSLVFTVFIADNTTGEAGNCFDEVISRDEMLTLNARGTEGDVTVLIDPATCFNIPGTIPQKITAACTLGNVKENFYTRFITNVRGQGPIGNGTVHITQTSATADCSVNVDDTGAIAGLGSLGQFIVTQNAP